MKLTDHGRVMVERKVLEVRDLTRDDLATIAAPRQPASVVKRIRDPHHRVARLLALGLRQAEVVRRSGYSQGRIHLLMRDPAFQDLVSKYRSVVDASFKETADDYTELAMGNMLKAEVQIAERLEAAEEEGETLPIRELIAISRDAADRFGYGKKQTNLNVNVDFAAQLESRLRRAKTINGESVPLQPVAGPLPDLQGEAQSHSPAVSASSTEPPRLRRLA